MESVFALKNSSMSTSDVVPRADTLVWVDALALPLVKSALPSEKITKWQDSPGVLRELSILFAVGGDAEALMVAK